MEYNGIFPNSTELPIPIYPVIANIGCMLLYYALFKYTLQKIIENLYSIANHFDHTERTIIYFFLINFPLIVLGVTSIVHNHSLVGIEISFTADQLQTFLLAAYICHLEESRQTPIRGFLFIRDLLVLIGCIGCFLKLYYDGQLTMEYGLILLSVYFVYYIMQLLEVKMEEVVLELLGLKESSAFNAGFLQTQERHEENYLQTEEIIEAHTKKIQQEIEQIKAITQKLIDDSQAQTILMNFAKLFIPYKCAYEFKEENIVKECLKEVEDTWSQGSMQEQISLENQVMEDMDNNSGTEFQQKNTLSDDQVEEVEQYEEKEEVCFDKVIKYTCYPVFLFSLAEDRLAYLAFYVSFFLLVGCMWLISHSTYYFVSQSNTIGFSLITIIEATMLVYPSAQYYIKISNNHDFDFINIFLQSSILKTVIFGIAITVTHFVFPNSICQGNVGIFIVLICRALTFLAFGIFMITHKFATHNDNIVFLTVMVVVSFLLRTILQLIVQVVVI